ncbi:MAG: hypothetical protein HQL28_03790, partial [Candidatus Omnitrophica bacterium]|nr:hypothetical protein [Candidatus Omnitrophota bacterium]
RSKLKPKFVPLTPVHQAMLSGKPVEEIANLMRLDTDEMAAAYWYWLSTDVGYENYTGEWLPKWTSEMCGKMLKKTVSIDAINAIVDRILFYEGRYREKLLKLLKERREICAKKSGTMLGMLIVDDEQLTGRCPKPGDTGAGIFQSVKDMAARGMGSSLPGRDIDKFFWTLNDGPGVTPKAASPAAPVEGKDRGRGDYISCLETLVNAGINSTEKAKTREELEAMRQFKKSAVSEELKGLAELGLVKIVGGEKPKYYVIGEMTREVVTRLKSDVPGLSSPKLTQFELESLKPRVNAILSAMLIVNVRQAMVRKDYSDALLKIECAIKAYESAEGGVGTKHELLINILAVLIDRIPQAPEDELGFIRTFFSGLKDRPEVLRSAAVTEIAFALLDRSETGEIGGQNDIKHIYHLSGMLRNELLTRRQRLQLSRARFSHIIGEDERRAIIDEIFDDLKEYILLRGGVTERPKASHRIVFNALSEAETREIESDISGDMEGAKILRKSNGKLAISRYVSEYANTTPYFAVVIDKNGVPLRVVCKDKYKSIAGKDNVAHIVGNSLLEAINAPHVWVKEGKKFVYIRQIVGLDMVDFLSRIDEYATDDIIMGKFFFSLGVAMSEAHITGMCDRAHNLVISMRKLKENSRAGLLNIAGRAIVNIDRENVLTERYLNKPAALDTAEAVGSFCNMAQWVLPQHRQIFTRNLENYLSGINAGYKTTRQYFLVHREFVEKDILAIVPPDKEALAAKITERITLSDTEIGKLIKNIREEIRTKLEIPASEGGTTRLPDRSMSINKKHEEVTLSLKEEQNGVKARALYHQVFDVEIGEGLKRSILSFADGEKRRTGKYDVRLAALGAIAQKEDKRKAIKALLAEGYEPPKVILLEKSVIEEILSGKGSLYPFELKANVAAMLGIERKGDWHETLRGLNSADKVHFAAKVLASIVLDGKYLLQLKTSELEKGDICYQAFGGHLKAPKKPSEELGKLEDHFKNVLGISGFDAATRRMDFYIPAGHFADLFGPNKVHYFRHAPRCMARELLQEFGTNIAHDSIGIVPAGAEVAVHIFNPDGFTRRIVKLEPEVRDGSGAKATSATETTKSSKFRVQSSEFDVRAHGNIELAASDERLATDVLSAIRRFESAVKALRDKIDEPGPAAEALRIFGEEDRESESLILYADDILHSVAVTDLEVTVRNALAAHGALKGGKVVIFGRKEANADILELVISVIGENSYGLGIEAVKVTEQELKASRNINGTERSEIEALVRHVGALGIKTENVLGIIKSSASAPEEIEATAKRLRIPVVIIGGEKGVYSFAEAIYRAMLIKRDNGSHGWHMSLPPVSTVSEDIKTLYNEYIMALEALVKA